VTSRYIPQLSFSFYRHRAIRADFSGGQITSDAACCLCGPLISGMGSLAICLSGFVIFAKMSGSSFRVVAVSPAPLPDHRWLRGRQRRGSLTSRSGVSNSCRSTTGCASRITTNSQPLGELALASRSPPSAGCSTRLVCEDLRRTGSANEGEILLDVDSTDDPTTDSSSSVSSTVVMTSTCITPC
jgi:hypothetical protein